MRTLSDRDLLIFQSPGVELRLRVDVLHGAERVLADQAGVDPVVSWDLTGEVKQVADLGIVYTDDQGGSILPKDFAAKVGPWGTDLQISLEAELNGQRVLAPAGLLMVESIPEAYDSDGWRVQGRTFNLGTTLVLKAKGLDERVARRGFGAERLAPPSGATCWGEIARLTGMKIARNVPDVAAPTLEYERAQRDRLKQVHALASRLGGVLVPDADGVLTLVPDTIGAPVGTISGTVVDAPYSLDSEGVYNEVIGNFEDPDRNPINVAPARVTSGPLAVTGPYGVYTRYYASEFVTNQAAAVSALAKILAQVSTPSFDRQVTTLIDPRVEIGDTWTITTPQGDVTGLVTSVQWDLRERTMQLIIRHQESVYVG